MSPRHQEALGHLLYGTGQYGGFVQLTGEVGTGKTTVIRTLLEQKLDEDRDFKRRFSSTGTLTRCQRVVNRVSWW